jgi:8-oxo-dGTP diphosphatase
MTKKYSYDYPKADVTADVVLFGFDKTDIKVLLIERARKDEAENGKWALPGGYLEIGKETLETCAMRELKEETGIDFNFLEQLHTFSDPLRDPRGPIITTAFLGLTNKLFIGTPDIEETSKVEWHSINNMPKLAFDHDEILKKAIARLQGKVEWKTIGWQPLGLKLLPKEFTLTEVQTLYETILKKEIDKRNFRKDIIQYIKQTKTIKNDNNPGPKPCWYTVKKKWS